MSNIKLLRFSRGQTTELQGGGHERITLLGK
jgi:hypothetical protein